MSDTTTSWSMPEGLNQFTERLADTAYRRVENISLAVRKVDEVVPDTDVIIDPYAPFNGGAYTGYGEAVLNAAEVPQAPVVNIAANRPAVAAVPELAPPIDSQAIRDRAQADDYTIKLNDKDEIRKILDQAAWDRDVLDPAATEIGMGQPSYVDAKAPSSQPPLPTSHDPLSNWLTPQSNKASVSQIAPYTPASTTPVLEFPHHTGPEAVTHQLPGNTPNEVVVAPERPSSMWSMTNEGPAATAVPQSQEVNEYEAQQDALAAARKAVQAASPSVSPLHHLVGA